MFQYGYNKTAVLAVKERKGGNWMGEKRKVPPPFFLLAWGGGKRRSLYDVAILWRKEKGS